jgi:TPR repeat protein
MKIKQPGGWASKGTFGKLSIQFYLLLLTSLSLAPIACSKQVSTERDHDVVRKLTERANQSDPNAKFALAMRLMEKPQGPKDVTAAIELLKSSSAAGNGHASLKLANLYMTGNQVGTNFAKAFYFASLSSRADILEGVFFLGFCHANGIGTTTNYAAALEQYRRAADGHLPEAEWALGKMYLMGTGTPRDTIRAKDLFQRAANQGHSLAEADLAGCYLLGDGTEVDYKEALKWALAAGTHGCSQGFNLAGLMYEKGMGVGKNEEEACRLYELAARKGNKKAQVNLGFLLVKRVHDSNDKVEAYKWLYLAAEAGETLAKEFVSECETKLMSTDLVAEGRRRAEGIRRAIVESSPNDAYARVNVSY